MADRTTIEAKSRDVIGKANRRLASAGQIPAVLYGGGREPLPLAVDRHDFELLMAHHAAGSTVVSLAVEGESKPVNAVVKAVQTSPVKGNILHVDFLSIRMDQKMQAQIGIHTVGESPGVKAGGIVMMATHTLNVEALPGEFPEAIEADISGLELGDTLTVADLTVAEGVEILDDRETVVCSVNLVKAVEEEVEEIVEAGEEEPELVGEETEAEAEE